MGVTSGDALSVGEGPRTDVVTWYNGNLSPVVPLIDLYHSTPCLLYVNARLVFVLQFKCMPVEATVVSHRQDVLVVVSSKVW
jgi:hypothetical protein